MQDGKYWVQHVKNGSSGWLVMPDDIKTPVSGPVPGVVVRINGGQLPVQTRPYADGLWKAVSSSAKLPVGTKASIAYRCVQEYARFTGDYATSSKDLSSFDDDTRIAIFKEGASAIPGRVGGDKVAQELWDAIMKVLERS